MGSKPLSGSLIQPQQYHMLHKIYVLLDDGDRRILRPFGLNLTQYRVLSFLDSKEGHRLTTLSDRLLRAKSTITRIVDQLEIDGLVRRLSDAEDRRAQRVVLTDAGVDLRDRVHAAHEQMVAYRIDQALSTDEQAQFQELLAKFHDSLVETLPTIEDVTRHREPG